MNSTIESRPILDDNHLYSAPWHSGKTTGFSEEHAFFFPSLRDEGPGDNDSVRRLWLHSHFTAGTELLDNAKLDVGNCLQMDFNIKWAPHIYWPWDLWLGTRRVRLQACQVKAAANYQKTIKQSLTKAQQPFSCFSELKN